MFIYIIITNETAECIALPESIAIIITVALVFMQK